MAKETMGKSYTRLIRECQALWRVMPDGPEKTKLGRKMDELLEANDKLIDESLPRKLDEYAQATKDIQDATAAAKAAQKDLEKISAVIDGIANAVSAVSRLLKAIGKA